MTGGSDDVRPPKGAPGAPEDVPKASATKADGERDGAGTPARPVSGPHTAADRDRLSRPDEEMDRLMGSGGVKPSIFAPPKTRTPKKTPIFTAPKIPSSKKAPAFGAPKASGNSERSGIAPPPSFGTMSKPNAPVTKTELGLPAVGGAPAEPDGPKEATEAESDAKTPDAKSDETKTDAKTPETKSIETKSDAKTPDAKPVEAKTPETETKPIETAKAVEGEPDAKTPETESADAEPDVKTPETESADAKPDAIPVETDAKSPETKAEPSVEPESETSESAAKPEPAEPTPTPAPAGPKPALRVVGDDEAETAEPTPARASRPTEPEPVPVDLSVDRPSGGPPWALIGIGALALAVGGYFVLGGDEAKPDPPPIAKASAETPSPSPTPTPAAGPKPTPLPDPVPSDDGANGQDTAGPEPTPGDSGGPPPAQPVTRSGDPREPPPGTPPEVAAVFRRLPVSPSDGPPIGGIGANGIHIDELRMGADVSGGCADATARFSVEGQDRAGVCVRVVHPREKDELQVLWEKHGGYTRRSKMVVLPKHAYRTRGYLKLRKEYIGDWTVRILSSDGVELAQYEFTIVP